MFAGMDWQQPAALALVAIAVLAWWRLRRRRRRAGGGCGTCAGHEPAPPLAERDRAA